MNELQINFRSAFSLKIQRVVSTSEMTALGVKVTAIPDSTLIEKTSVKRERKRSIKDDYDAPISQTR
jgi:hypothetical protein